MRSTHPERPPRENPHTFEVQVALVRAWGGHRGRPVRDRHPERRVGAERAAAGSRSGPLRQPPVPDPGFGIRCTSHHHTGSNPAGQLLDAITSPLSLAPRTSERSPKRSAPFARHRCDGDVNRAIEPAVQLFLERLAVAAPVTSAEKPYVCLASSSNVSRMYSSACRASRSRAGV